MESCSRMSSFSSSLELVSVQLSVSSNCRFAQRAKIARKASSDATTTRASDRRRCARGCAGGLTLTREPRRAPHAQWRAHEFHGEARLTVAWLSVVDELAIGLGEEQQCCFHALAHVVGARQAELHEDRVDVLLDRA